MNNRLPANEQPNTPDPRPLRIARRRCQVLIVSLYSRQPLAFVRIQRLLRALRSKGGEAMASVNITAVNVLDNPAPYTNPLQFEIHYECLNDLEDGAFDLRRSCAVHGP